MEPYIMTEKNLVQFNTRIPPGLKEKILISVEKNNRSINSETIFLLTKGLEADNSESQNKLAHIPTELLIDALRDRFGNISITFNSPTE